MIAAGWPLAFGLLVSAAELARGRVDLRLVGSALLLGLLFSVIGAVVFDVGETRRQRGATANRLAAPALVTDAIVFVGALLTMALTPWNTLPAIGFAGLALGSAVAQLLLVARRRARGQQPVAVVVSLAVALVLGGGGAILTGMLSAVARAGLGVLSTELPPPPTR
jgi:uncharacterized membrane protein AbrB (regulator of aidB expression)